MENENIQPKEKVSFKKAFWTLMRSLLVLLGIISAAFLKSCWPGVLFALTSWLVISSQTVGEEVKSRGSFENTWSIVLTVIGVVGLVLLYTSTPYGEAIYRSFFEIMFFSSGNWGEITLHEGVTSIVMAILLSLSMAASKVHWKQSLLQLATILVLFLVASAFSESRIPRKSIPEDLDLVTYQALDQGISGDSTTTTEKKEVLNPKIQKGVDFASKWKRLGLLIFGLCFVTFLFIKKIDLDNKVFLLKLLGSVGFIASMVALVAILGQKSQTFENLLHYKLGNNYPIYAGLVIGLIILSILYFLMFKKDTKKPDWFVNVFEESETTY